MWVVFWILSQPELFCSLLSVSSWVPPSQAIGKRRSLPCLEEQYHIARHRPWKQDMSLTRQSEFESHSSKPKLCAVKKKGSHQIQALPIRSPLRQQVIGQGSQLSDRLLEITSSVGSWLPFLFICLLPGEKSKYLLPTAIPFLGEQHCGSGAVCALNKGASWEGNRGLKYSLCLAFWAVCPGMPFYLLRERTFFFVQRC